MTLHGISPLMMRAPTTGLRGAVAGSSSRRLVRTRLASDVGEYWAPGRPRLPVSSQTSFSR